MTLEQIKDCFRAAGWYEGRNIDISEYQQVALKNGYCLHNAAQNFFKEFGGLEFKFAPDYSVIDPVWWAKVLSGKDKPHMKTFDSDPLNIINLDDIVVKSYARHVEENIINIASIDPGSYFFFIGESGRFYVFSGDESCIRLCNDFWQVMHDKFNVIHIKPVEHVKMIDDFG